MAARKFTKAPGNPAKKILHGKKGRYGKDKRFKNSLGSWDSGDEFKRWLYLADLEKKGTITDLEKAPRYVFELNGVRIGSFRPDARYKVGDVLVVEDFKGKVITREFKRQVKLLKAFFGLDVVIVTEPTDITPITNAMRGKNAKPE